jgi:hypothetical protein
MGRAQTPRDFLVLLNVTKYKILDNLLSSQMGTPLRADPTRMASRTWGHLWSNELFPFRAALVNVADNRGVLLERVQLPLLSRAIYRGRETTAGS